MSSTPAQWAVRNAAGRTWRYQSARLAEANRATSESLVVSNGLTWEYVWTGPDPVPAHLLEDR